MQFDEGKVDEMILALLYLNFWEDHGVVRAWKSFDWESMGRLYEKGYIDNPKSKAKSVVMTEGGRERAEELFKRYFTM